MSTLPDSVDDAQIPGSRRGYPGFGLTCFVCGHKVEEFHHFRNATVMIHHGQKCILWKVDAHADNV